MRTPAIAIKPMPGNAGLFGQRQTWPYADTNNHDAGFKHTTTFQRRTLAFDGDHSIFKMKHDPVLLMQRTNEIADIDTLTSERR